MSNALAIAAVTAVLKDLLNNGLIRHDLSAAVGTVAVTAKPPDLITTGQNEGPQLNLFLYHVTPNAGWRNVGLPSRDAAGARVANPPLALDLHYLLMAYGGTDFQAEILLGYAMQLLHETPTLDRDAIRTALAPAPPVTGSILPPAFQALSAADLAEQVEQIKIVPETLNIEELSKLWSAFQANHYRLTTAYQVSTVLIESRKSTRSAPPVLKRKLYVVPLQRPVIDTVRSTVEPPDDSRITPATTLAIRGTDLRGPTTIVRVGDGVAPAAALTLGAREITVDLAQLTGLRAGVQAVQVVHEVAMGEPDPGTPRPVVESNVAPFVLQPTVTVPATVAGPAGALTVTFTPLVGKGQRLTLVLYEFDAPATRAARAFSFPAPKDNGVVDPATETSSVTFDFTGVPAGDYLVWVQVDGAESIVAATTDKLDTPKVTVT